MTKRRTMKLGG